MFSGLKICSVKQCPLRIRVITTLLKEQNNDFQPLRKGWSSKLIKRHPGLKTGRGKSVELARLIALTYEV